MDVLPKDVIQYILVHLDIVSISHFGRTCKIFNAIADSDIVWKHFCVQEDYKPNSSYSTWKDLFKHMSGKFLVPTPF
jgi:hypothetical protein